MALDGACLRHIIRELEEAVGARIDKIYQPNREELLLSLRSRTDFYKMLLSARANSARVHFTKSTIENPKQPPMFCMLLRKRLGGAKLSAIRQDGLERACYLDFDGFNELGDPVRLTLAIEIMGRYSNVIFLDQEGTIIDALKRVDEEMSSERLVLPGIRYRPPPAQQKLCCLDVSPHQVLSRLDALEKEQELSQALLLVLQGVSPIVCREIQHRAGQGETLWGKARTPVQTARLLEELERLFSLIRQTAGQPCMLLRPDGKPLDFSFLNIEQYGTAAEKQFPASFSEMLDQFYGERDRLERIKARSADLYRLLTTISERLSRKINIQTEELRRCTKRDFWKICGDLLSANLYRIQKGDTSIELENFYEETCPTVQISLDPLLTPAQNAQKYYKEYRKAHTAEEKLTEQITQAKQELEYIDSVLDALSRARTERDLDELRQELREQGYLTAKSRQTKQKSLSPSAPLTFSVRDGFTVWVGRNNRQNDRLTLKDAHRNDIWLHVKDHPGSHVVLVTERREPTESALLDAAKIAAYFSRCRDSSQVPVDYTQVRYVSKPPGAKPGRVIYVHYRTLYVTPEEPAST